MILVQAWVFLKFILNWLYYQFIQRFFYVRDEDFHKMVQHLEMSEKDQITEFTRNLQNEQAENGLSPSFDTAQSYSNSLESVDAEVGEAVSKNVHSA